MARIGWWVVTPALCAMMLFSAFLYLTKADAMVVAMAHLGYPLYLMPLFGALKLLGALALLVPGTPRGVRSWAYAGFTFLFVGAIWSHLSAGDGAAGAAPAFVALALALSSFAFGRQTGRT